ncbi:MAG: Lipopolysaccharide export system protein LptA [Rhodospirillales bacterium]|nr:Lipopolysaccharide export system protein LptA [Rhodospirillales bacterium]
MRTLLVLALLLPAAAMGQALDMTRGGPVDVTAEDGIEWRQQEQLVIARGNARAVRDGVTIEADRLIARYRPRAAAGTAAPAAPAARPPGAGAGDPTSGASEIWRFEAEGNVRIHTATDRANGDRAVYDIDQAVMVITGRDLWLTATDNRVTARDSLEYWPQRRMAVARGGAVVDAPESRRIRGDTLVAFFLEEGAAGAPAPRPVAPPTPGTPGQPQTGRIERVEAYGNVEVRTTAEVVRGERAVYSPVTSLARVLGNVRITRGENQLNGNEAIVNLATGVARLVSTPGARVQGLIVPQSEDATLPGATPPSGTRPPATPPGGTRTPAANETRPPERRP